MASKLSTEVIERAHRGRKFMREHMPRTIERIRYWRKNPALLDCYSSAGSDHVNLGIYAYFIDGDLNALRQHMHVGVLLRLVAVRAWSREHLQTPHLFFYALLSNNPTLITTVMNLETPDFASHREQPLVNVFKLHMWQLALRGDFEALRHKVEKLAKNGRKADRASAANKTDFFSLLMAGDQKALEAWILESAKRSKDDDPMTEDFLAFDASLAAKVCWFRGIEVQVEHPLVPLALMPMEPLDHYDDVYDFLAPAWKPPLQGRLGQAVRWIKGLAGSL
jgi:hypothetical protein